MRPPLVHKKCFCFSKHLVFSIGESFFFSFFFCYFTNLFARQIPNGIFLWSGLKWTVLPAVVLFSFFIAIIARTMVCWLLLWIISKVIIFTRKTWIVTTIIAIWWIWWIWWCRIVIFKWIKIVLALFTFQWCCIEYIDRIVLTGFIRGFAFFNWIGHGKCHSTHKINNFQWWHLFWLEWLARHDFIVRQKMFFSS